MRTKKNDTDIIIMCSNAGAEAGNSAQMRTTTHVHSCRRGNTHAWTHTTTHAHPWKKTLALRPHRVHVSPSGIINTMLMNIGPGHVQRRERERWRELLGEMERERGQKVGGWRRIMNSLLTNALPEVVVGGINMDLKKKKNGKNGSRGGREARK